MKRNEVSLIPCLVALIDRRLQNQSDKPVHLLWGFDGTQFAYPILLAGYAYRLHLSAYVKQIRSAPFLARGLVSAS